MPEEPKAEEGKNITLELIDVDIQQALTMLAKASGTNIVISKGIEGKVPAVIFKDVPLEQALKQIVESMNYSWVKTDNNVYVVSPTPPEKPATITEEAPIKRVAEKPEEPIVVEKIKIKYLSARELAQAFGGVSVEPPLPELPNPFNLANQFNANVSNYLGSLPLETGLGNSNLGGFGDLNLFGTRQFPGEMMPGMGRRGRQVPGMMAPGMMPGAPGAAVPGAVPGAPAAAPGMAAGMAGLSLLWPTGMRPPVAYLIDNSLFVTGTPSQIEEVRRLLAMLDIPRKQVLIEAQFITMRVSDAEAMGIEWSILGTNPDIMATGYAPLPAMEPFINIRYATGNFNALLRMVRSSGKGKNIAAPKVRTSSGQLAAIVFSESVPIVITASTFGQFGQAIQTFRIPILLPVVSGLIIYPEVRGGEAPPYFVDLFLQPVIARAVADPQTGLPTISQQTVQPGIITIKDGETIVIGGLVTKDQSKKERRIPFLNELPLIGNLFKSTDFSTSDVETLVFLTCHVFDVDISEVVR
ncbi:MAG: secretin and TonB N-terminal domain-containing protein [candidate division WOR-3 bacterium]